eukprot:262-Rhodomonas_salina.2
MYGVPFSVGDSSCVSSRILELLHALEVPAPSCHVNGLNSKLVDNADVCSRINETCHALEVSVQSCHVDRMIFFVVDSFDVCPRIDETLHALEVSVPGCLMYGVTPIAVRSARRQAPASLSSFTHSKCPPRAAK